MIWRGGKTDVYVQTAVVGCESHVVVPLDAGEGLEVCVYFGEGGGMEGEDAGYEFDTVGAPVL